MLRQYHGPPLSVVAHLCFLCFLFFFVFLCFAMLFVCSFCFTLFFCFSFHPDAFCIADKAGLTAEAMEPPHLCPPHPNSKGYWDLDAAHDARRVPLLHAEGVAGHPARAPRRAAIAILLQAVMAVAVGFEDGSVARGVEAGGRRGSHLRAGGRRAGGGAES